MGNIPAAKTSPRVENGCLCWYEGDTFEIQMQIELTDQDRQNENILESDIVTITFYDESRAIVQEFAFQNVQGNTVTLSFTDEISKKFLKGRYRYDMLYTYNNKTTLIRDNVAIVS